MLHSLTSSLRAFMAKQFQAELVDYYVKFGCSEAGRREEKAVR